MYSYIKGIVVGNTSNAIVIENNEIGYLIYVANPFNYKIGEKYTIYIYNDLRGDEN